MKEMEQVKMKRTQKHSIPLPNIDSNRFLFKYPDSLITIRRFYVHMRIWCVRFGGANVIHSDTLFSFVWLSNISVFSWLAILCGACFGYLYTIYIEVLYDNFFFHILLMHVCFRWSLLMIIIAQTE